MRPSPHLTFGFHKVWNKRQGQNNQRGAQANKSVYSSSSTLSLVSAPSHTCPHHCSTLGGERGITFSEPPQQQVTFGPVLTWNNSMCCSGCKTKGKTGRKAGSREFMWRHIVDNQLVCLCMFGHENKSKAYITVMELLLKQSALQQ